MIWITAAILGATWRRWLGSERPEWAWMGYRATQIAAGIVILCGLCVSFGDGLLYASIKAAAVIGFMTLPISISRQPFLWIARKLPLPTTKNDWLNGPEPWAEVFEGAVLWGLAILL